MCVYVSTIRVFMSVCVLLCLCVYVCGRSFMRRLYGSSQYHHDDGIVLYCNVYNRSLFVTFESNTDYLSLFVLVYLIGLYI